MIVEGIKVPGMIRDCKEVTGLLPLGDDDGLLVVLALFLFKERSGLKSTLAKALKYSSTRPKNLLACVYLFAARVRFQLDLISCLHGKIFPPQLLLVLLENP